MHFSESEALASRNSRYLDGIGMMVSYGITGSMVAAFASPALVRGLVDGLGAQAVQRMGMEAGLQVRTSLVFNGNFKKMDFADIVLSGIMGKLAFVPQALVDYDYQFGLTTSFGGDPQKTLWETSIDLAVGGFNSGYSHLLDISGINSKVVSILSFTNGTMRNAAGEAASQK
ncbi:MAG: hypothetical protein R6V72_15285 [Cyclobacterium sp.]|uniref:hypothetical protein n=1 Tax=Cyclobacterium sp. TaxID=1966343 RepID=UPI003970DADE